MDASKVVIQMKDIVKKFGDFTANDHINLTVHKERYMRSWERMEPERVP